MGMFGCDSCTTAAAAASPRNNYSSLYIHKTKCCSRCRCAAMPAEQAFIMAYGSFLQLSRQSILFIPLGRNKFVLLARSLSLSLYDNFVLRTSVRPSGRGHDTSPTSPTRFTCVCARPLAYNHIRS
jgi:hypothetical protein